MNYLKNILKGVAIGIATLVPGVSGGTMAIILGVYDALIHAVASFVEDWKKHAILLLEIGAGTVLGVSLFSRLLGEALDKYPHIMQFLFMGIIIGGLPVLYRKSTEYDRGVKSNFIFLILGFAIVLLMSSDPAATITLATSKGLVGVLFLFVAGIIIAIALVLPGISASFMLLALGLYGLTLDAINNLNIPFLIPLGLGVLVGSLAIAKLIEKVLQKYPGKTYMMIMGFVIGSLILVFPGVPSGIQLVLSAAAFIIGFLVIFWMGKKGLAD